MCPALSYEYLESGWNQWSEFKGNIKTTAQSYSRTDYGYAVLCSYVDYF